jgi:hypothetical protein
MAITRKKPAAAIPDEATAAAFIKGAPDGSRTPPVKQIKTLGRKSIITVSISPDVLQRLDAWALAHGMSRAAAVSFAVSKLD